MTFDMSNIHTIFESALEPKVDTSAVNDETGANLDNTLSYSDLLAIYDDICPISGDVYASMKNAAKDPKNLKITMTKGGNGEESKLFVEAVEFMTFCEANEMNVGEAAEEIVDTYKEEIPGVENAEFHVVFPSDSLNKNILGGENLGQAVKNDWAMELMRGCRRYGLKCNAGVDNDSMHESTVDDESENNFLNEFFKSSKKVENEKPKQKRVISKEEFHKALSFVKSFITKNEYFKSYVSKISNKFATDEDYDKYTKSKDNYITIASFDTDDWGLKDSEYNKIADGFDTSSIDGHEISEDLCIDTDWNGHRLDVRLKFKNSKFYEATVDDDRKKK